MQGQLHGLTGAGDGALHRVTLITAVVDRPCRGEPERMTVDAHHACAERVERRDRESASTGDVGRDELVEKESSERAVLEAYLPAAPDAEEIERIVRAVIEETGASGPRDMGRVMKPALDRLGPAADGKSVSETVKRLLSG